MIAAWLIAALVSCGDKDVDIDGAACCSDAGNLWADTPWSLVQVDPLGTSVAGITVAPRRVFRASGSDYVYIVKADGTAVRMLGPSWMQPTGRWCVDGNGSAEECQGTLVTSGLVELAESTGACLDDVDDQLLLMKPGGARIDVVGTSRRGTSWKSFNRAESFLAVGKAEDEQPDQACAARAGRRALSTNSNVLLLDDDNQVTSRIPMAGGARRLGFVGDSRWLVAHAENGSVWTLDSEAGTAVEIVPTGQANALAIDDERGVVWIARTGGVLVRVPFGVDGAGALEEVSVCGRVSDLAVDHRTGAVHLLARCSAAPSGYELLVVDRWGVRASQHLDEVPLGLVPPGNLGQLAALVRTEPSKDSGGQEISAQTEIRAWHVVDPTDTRPPLSAFVITTLEQPFTNATMACTRGENAGTNFESYVEQLQANIPVLAETGLPVAVGVTWEFGTKARECGLDGVIDELADAGFALGTMVHDKPCFSCSSAEVPGETAESCTAADPDYADPTDEDACWPSDENYCSRGDQDCWFEWVGQKALDVDEWIPGGSQFIFGADRHKLWDFEYLADGYRSFPRANGTEGYTITMFQGTWVYDAINDVDDPRAKDPAPWTPELLGTTWFPADVASWEQDSAFSELLYMPGNSAALSRVYDMVETDLSLVHLFDEAESLVVTEDDTDALFVQLGQFAAHRNDGPGTWYFHLADLTGYPLKPDEGDERIDQQALLLQFKADIDAYYGEEGLGWVQWRGPLEVRADVP